MEILIDRSERILNCYAFFSIPFSDFKDYFVFPLEVIFFDNLIFCNNTFSHDLQETIEINHPDM